MDWFFLVKIYLNFQRLRLLSLWFRVRLVLRFAAFVLFDGLFFVCQLLVLSLILRTFIFWLNGRFNGLFYLVSAIINIIFLIFDNIKNLSISFLLLDYFRGIIGLTLLDFRLGLLPRELVLIPKQHRLLLLNFALSDRDYFLENLLLLLDLVPI